MNKDKNRAVLRLYFLYNSRMPEKSLPNIFRYLFPKLEDILFITILGMCFLLGSRMLSIDSDIGRHITVGRYIFETKHIPTLDILSHTKINESRPPYEWLSQLLFALADKFAGLDGVILFCSILIAITFLLIYQESVKRSHTPLLSIVLTILGVSASSIHWLPRPHVITFLMLFLWVQQLEDLSKDKELKMWKFSIIMLLWANLHGGFIFGFLTWFAYVAGAVWDKFIKRNPVNLLNVLSVGIVSSIASIITPDGWGNWLAVLGNNSQYILQNTAETMSPNFYQAGMLPFLLLLGLTIALPALTNTALRTSQVFLLAGMAMASLLVARNIPLFVVIAIPILSECIQLNKLSPWIEKIESRISLLQLQLKSYWVFIAIISLTLFIFNKHSSHQTPIMQFNPNVFPVQAVEWLKENPQAGNMFNEFNWGGYIEYELYPSQKVFLDSQTDFYGEALVKEYTTVINAETEWESILQKYNVSWVFIYKHSPLDVLLTENQAWELIYQDNIAVIYRKK